VREWTLTLLRELQLWELESQWTLEFLESNCRGQNLIDRRVLYIIKKLLECRCLKWDRMTHLDTSNTSYGQKKGWESIWLLTTKSEESPWFPCMQVACNISLKRSRREIQLCFRPHLNQSLHTKLWAPKVAGILIMGISGLSLWESWDKMIWVLVLWLSRKYTIGGKVVASSKSGLWGVLWVCVCLWLVRAPKCPNYALTNLLFGLCRFVWISEMLVNLPNPILELQHTLLPPKCYKPGNTPQLFVLPMSSPLGSQLIPSRNLGVRQ
jgi:hypothetical protein